MTDLDPKATLDDMRRRSALPKSQQPEDAPVDLVEEHIKWLEKHWTVPPGKPFSIKGRDWVREFFRALDGFKAWPNESGGHLCDECADMVGEVISSENEVEYSNTPEHRRTGCGGLQAHSIRLVFIDADRRSGKSTNLFAYYSRIMHSEKNMRMRFLASGYVHTMDIANENYIKPLQGNPNLSRKVDVRWDDKRAFCQHQKRNNRLSFGSSSHSSNLGGSFDYVAFDEARATDFTIVSALLPTLQENYGIRCSRCTYKSYGGMGDLTYKDECPTCGAHTLRRWNGKAIFMSNRSVITDDPKKDWFQAFVDDLLTRPLGFCHVIKLDDNVVANPDIDAGFKQDVYELIERHPDLKPYIDVEFGNESRRVGELYLNPAESARMVDKSLSNVTDGSMEPVFFYIDTARVTDMVVIAGYADDTSNAGFGEDPWTRLRGIWCDVYNPKDPNNGVTYVDEQGVRCINKDLLAQRLFEIGRKFPNLIGMWIDTRGSEFAKDLVKKVRENTNNPWRSLVHPYEERDARETGYNQLHLKTLNGQIRVIPHPRLETELNKAVWVDVGGRYVVREANKSSRKRARYHLEVLDAHANACFLATRVRKKQSSSIREIRQIERNAKRNHKRQLGSRDDELGERVKSIAKKHGIGIDRF